MRSVVWRTLMLAGILALALGAVACGGGDDDGGDGDGAAQEGDGAAQEGGTESGDRSFELQVGQIVPLTGDLSVFGPPGEKAGNMAVEQVNAAFEEAGADVTVSIESADEQTDPQAAVSAARQLTAGGATCLAGAWASGDTIPVAEAVAIRERVPLISPASTSAEITGLEDDGFVFRTAPSDDLQAVALADVVEEELGGADGTVSLAARNDAYGEGFATSFQEAWEERGGTISGPVLYDPEQASFNSEAGQIVSGDPDAFVIIAFPEDYARVGAALVRTGGFDATRLFVTDGLAAEEIPEGIPPEALEGATGTRPGTPEAGEAAQAFSTLYDESPGPEQRQTFDAQSFDAVMLCILAAAQANSADSQDIAESIVSVSGPPGEKLTFEQLPDAIATMSEGGDVDYEGASGPIDLDDNGDPTTATYEVYTYADGALEVERSFEAQQEE